MIKRDYYLKQLISKKENGMIKVITGIRRCGKSTLLFEIYHNYLISIGIQPNQIIELSLDDDENIRYRNPLELGKKIRSLLIDENKIYYVFLDKIQKVKTIKNLNINVKKVNPSYYRLFPNSHLCLALNAW